MNLDFDRDNILDQSFRNGSFYENPYPVYKKLRSDAPVLWSANKAGYYITTYRYIRTIVEQYPLYKKFTSSLEFIRNPVVRCEVLNFITQWPFYRNNAYQNEKVRAQQFIKSNIGKANELINQYDLTIEECNLVDSLFIPIALKSILSVLDVNENEFDNILHFSTYILRLMQNDLSLDDESKLKQCIEYFRNLYSEYSHQEIVDYGVFCNLLIDGYEPLAQTLTSSILVYPEQQPSKEHVDIFVNEVVRMFPAFQYLVRYADCEIQLDNYLLPKDSKMYLVIASANRDETIYNESEQFLYERKTKISMSFGRGMHSCMGGKLTHQIVSTFIKTIISSQKQIHINRFSRSVRFCAGTLFTNELRGSIN